MGMPQASAANAAAVHPFLVAAPIEVPEPTPVTIDLPAEGTIYPPDLIPPQFAWRDESPDAKVWRIEIVFGGRGRAIQVWSQGEKMQIGEIDAQITGFVPPELTPVQAADHTWRPDAKMWAEIKKHSVEGPATLTVLGYASQDGKPVSRAQRTFVTSKDPVGAPIFYRDVPLVTPSPAEMGVRGQIKPLPDSMIPTIQWRLRYVGETQSKIVMGGLPTCANCHSLARDGKTLGIDVDGPGNDKGLYALIPIRKVSTISNDYVIHWSAFSEEKAQKRFGFMSQISPDGKFVVTSIDVPHAHGVRVLDRLYNGFYANYGFAQVFYPTRGVLAWYSKDSGKLEPLPGADDPNYVQTSGFWSPDGKYIIYSRAVARDPYPPGAQQSTYANDPNETQIQYDLYKIPFNDGRGGTPERVIGASENGMSNDFPKVSPDGKWIIWVQNKNGLLMRPDSKLYIVPFAGGEARALQSNLPVMNSWHSFSPNGHWLVFSSKSPSLYTHMYLTHIDEAGNASAPLVVENATAANRAVNIPEFVNIEHGGLERIDAPATEFYRLFDVASRLSEKHKYEEAIPAWRKALEIDAGDARSHNNLGVALAALGKSQEAEDEYATALKLNTEDAQAQSNLGSQLAEAGQLDEAVVHFRRAVELRPTNATAHINLGHALAEEGGHADEALSELRKAVELAPESAEAHNILGVFLARSGNLEEGLEHMQKAVELGPDSVEFHFNLGRGLAAKSRFGEALPQLEAAAKFSNGQDAAVLQMLAAMYSENGRYTEAVTTAQRALALAVKQQNDALAAALKGNLERYTLQARGELAPDGTKR